MMGWEAPLMHEHAKVIAGGIEGKDVCNIGFGLGLIDGELQQLKPRSHTIIEAHPDVHARIIAEGWHERPGVTVIFARWQDVLMDIGPFDGLFYDTYAESYIDLRSITPLLSIVLRPQGIFSFFNGLAPFNHFYYDVYCRIAEEDLKDGGWKVSYTTLQVAQLGDEVWQGLRRKYWALDMYRLPRVTRLLR